MTRLHVRTGPDEMPTLSAVTREKYVIRAAPALYHAFPQEYYKQYSKNATQNTTERGKTILGNLQRFNTDVSGQKKNLTRKEYELLYFSLFTGTNKKKVKN